MLQEYRLFYKNWFRCLLLICLCFIGFRHFARGFIDLGNVGLGRSLDLAFGTLQVQIPEMAYYFVIFLMLSFELFREWADANLLDIIPISGRWFTELKLFLVLLTNLLVFWLLQLCCYLFFCLRAEVYEMQGIMYLVRFTGTYILLNGIVAIIAGWMISKIPRRVIGYICVVLYAIMISPIITEWISFVSLWANEIHNSSRLLLIMPEGGAGTEPIPMFPLNSSIVCRILFWIFLWSGCLILFFYYKKLRANKVQMLVVFIGMICACGFCVYYSGLPYSFYCNDGSLSVTDSISYDQMTYDIGDGIQVLGENDADNFDVESYSMRFKIDRQLNADVIVKVSEKLPVYNMTLYHLYIVDRVLNENGTELQYVRQGDTLSVLADKGVLELHIQYHGGCSNFYSNYNSVNLPGWFPYYPVPGKRAVYGENGEYKYNSNVLTEKVMFDIEINIPCDVYSNLESVGKNHFVGETTAPTLVAGFVKEETTSNGIRYVYPYMSLMHNPKSEYCSESYSKVLEEAEKLGIQTIIFIPRLAGDGCYINDGKCIIDYTDWGTLDSEYQEYGEFVREY